MRRLALCALALAALSFTACGSNDASSTAPAPTVPTEPTEEGAPCPANEEFTRKLVGKTEDEARTIATGNGCTLRVTERDGKPSAVTLDYREDRVNVTVEDGRVKQVTGVG
ncbi:MAG: hypothetical protein V9E83_10625 [Baekduia sp.]